MLLLLRTHHLNTAYMKPSKHCLYDTKAFALANIPVLLFESLSLSLVLLNLVYARLPLSRV